MPGVQVVLINTGTNVSSTTRTTEVGRYVFVGVFPGAYRLVVEAPNMQKYEETFSAQVEQSVVVDPVLEPGAVTTQVEVRDVVPMLTVDSAVAGQALARNDIEQLPIQGRRLKTLLAVIPEMDDVRALGAPEGAAEFMLDGAPTMTQRWANHSTIFLSGMLDSIQEMRLDFNATSSKNSRPTTLVISTRGGSNQFHGSAFETHRNSGFGVARQRQDTYTKPPHLVRNEFGVSAGGPVLLPKLYDGKNRTFWFTAYEAEREYASSTRGWSVPTMAMRQGDFSGLVQSDGRKPTLYDPWSTTATNARQPFSDGGVLNKIPLQRMSPLAKYLFSITPEPTTTANPLAESNWWGSAPAGNLSWSFSTRIDHNISDRDRLYGRYTQAVRTELGASGGQMMLNGVPPGTMYTNYPSKSLSLNYIRTFSPTFFNELLVSGYRNKYWNGPGGERKDWAGMLGLPNPFRVDRFPQISGTGLSNYSFTTNLVQRYTSAFVVLEDNATKLYGRHELQFGFHYRYDQNNQEGQQQYVEGNHNFSTLATALYDPKSTPTNPIAQGLTGHNLANMFIGVMNYSNNLARGYYMLRNRDYALYLQDNINVTPRLTLNLGLRYEYWPVTREKFNTLSGYDVSSKSVILTSSLAEMQTMGATVPSVLARYQQLGVKFVDWSTTGLPRTLINGNRGDLGPRLGFAYRALSGRSAFVFRGGYSLSYFTTPIYLWQDSDRNNVPFNATFSNSVTDAALSPDGLPNRGLRSAPTIIAGVNSQNVIALDQPQGISRGSGRMNFMAPDQPTSRLHTWNVTVEKELMTATVARVRYLGNHGANVGYYHSLNDAPSDYIWYVTTRQPKPTGEYASVAMRPLDNTSLGQIRMFRKTGWSNFNGVELQMERRYQKFSAFQITYIVGNTLSTASTAMQELNQFLPGAVPADYNERLRVLNYQRNTANNNAKHRVRWNWLLELPVGRGKPLGRNMNGALDKLLGGWQLSGIGWLRSTFFTLPTSIYPVTGNALQIYGYKYPIQDCRSGVCVPGYLWWNGYIPAHQINSVGADGKPNGVMGVPADYKAAAQPLIPHNATGYAAGDLGTNNVWVTLQNGATQKVSYNDNLHPWRNQFIPSVRQWSVDASAVKNVRIAERLELRLNIDFFNVFNSPGNNSNVGSDGILKTNTSANAARTAQLGARLTW